MRQQFRVGENEKKEWESFSVSLVNPLPKSKISASPQGGGGFVALLSLFCACLFFAACSPDAERAGPPPASGDNVEVVNGLMAAFNDHDADKMREFWAPDVTWIELSGEQASTVTTSAEQLHDELVAYFEAYPSVSSSLEHISVNGHFVTAIERPVWEEGGERMSQSSVVVYEIIDGKVKRFWYYPPQ
ncbi:nuclear transport factor 2 family protein [Hyphococcus luteus]|uniref:nuclear transport factor 2 family protein n=1 Tax=Hyphococcus luteus TaxID=2058213 RepID=UPI0013FDEA66|nr:nuclear transport factor 2 family protein [Marinicaulis flavus]